MIENVPFEGLLLSTPGQSVGSSEIQVFLLIRTSIIVKVLF